MTQPPGIVRHLKPTAKAVAERAGVSVTTVSRVVNDRAGDISPETRDRVLEAARALRYRPSSLAASLRRGYTRTVGLIVPDIADAYFHQIARGLDDAAQAAGYTMVLCNTDRVAEKERSCIEVLYDRNVDAIVFAGGGVDNDTHLLDLPWDMMHVVTVGPHRLPFPSIRVDDVGTIKMAMTHLFDQGCERVLCLAGKENWLINTERLEGYWRALAERGLAYEKDLVMAGDFTVKSGYDSVIQALAGRTDFDGVMAFNDYTAVGAIRALQDSGRRVPDDVAVVGCDDIPLASLVSPKLTSVSFPQRDFGRAAMEAVLNLLAGRPVEPVTQFDYHLEVRASSMVASQAVA